MNITYASCTLALVPSSAQASVGSWCIFTSSHNGQVTWIGKAFIHICENGWIHGGGDTVETPLLLLLLLYSFLIFIILILLILLRQKLLILPLSHNIYYIFSSTRKSQTYHLCKLEPRFGTQHYTST